MKVLITGGAGFIGSHIIEHILRNTDWDIISLDRLNVSGNYKRLTDMSCWEKEGHRVRSVVHDLRCAVNDLVAADIGQVDYILHLGASTHVDRSIVDPMSFVLDNVVGTTNILQFARKLNDPEYLHESKGMLKAFLYFSTDEVFGPAPGFTAYKEWDRYNSGNPYAAAKAGGEEMALAYANTYKLPVIITHTMNVFGERQHPEKFIPLVMSKVWRGETVKIHANKDKTKAGSRFWIHGRNVAAAILYLLKNYDGEPADKFNIVGEREVDNLAMAQMIAKFMDMELKYEMVDFHSSRPGHDLRYGLDGNKMKQLGWELPVDFEDSLRRTVEWTMMNPKWLSI